MLFSKLKQSCLSLCTIFLLGFTLSGCESLVDCIDDDQPVLAGALPNPVLNQVYDHGLTVGIRNEPNDSRFAYNFSLQGSIPAGMSYRSSGQTFRFTGTPTTTGTYDFSVSVRVEDALLGSNDTGGLCSTFDSESFQWTVQVM